MSEGTVIDPVADASLPIESAPPTEPVAADVSAPVPVEYGEFAIPEGATYDPEIGAEFTAAAKELGLSKDQAQGLVDLGAKMQTQMLAAQAAHIETVSAQWADEARSDKEIGGENFEANLSIAKLALDHVASPALIEQLNTTGLGNHPDMIRALYRMGKLLKEDGQLKVENTPGDSKVSIAQQLYPNMNP
jgi:hypothetical protein